MDYAVNTSFSPYKDRFDGCPLAAGLEAANFIEGGVT